MQIKTILSYLFAFLVLVSSLDLMIFSDPTMSWLSVPTTRLIWSDLLSSTRRCLLRSTTNLVSRWSPTSLLRFRMWLAIWERAALLCPVCVWQSMYQNLKGLIWIFLAQESWASDCLKHILELIKGSFFHQRSSWFYFVTFSVIFRDLLVRWSAFRLTW